MKQALSSLSSISRFTKLLLAAVFVSSTTFIYTATGAPPGSPYDLGETLAPTCAPGDANCTVVVPLQSGANSSATLGIGTAAAPDAAIEIDTDTGGFPDGWAENLKLTSQEYPALWLHAESDDEGWIIGADEGDGLWIATSDGTSAGDNLFVIEEGGFVGIGTTDPGELLELAADDDADLDIYTANTTNSDHSTIHVHNSRGTLAVPLVSVDGDEISTWEALGHDGTDYEPVGYIDFIVDGTPGNDDMPGAIQFATTEDGDDSPEVRMTIDNEGFVGIGTTSPGELLDIRGEGDADIDITSANNTNSDWSDLAFWGSRGTLSAPLISQDGDDIAAINVFGYDGSGYEPLASIDFIVSDTPGSDDMPGSIVFATTGDGDDFTSDRMTIDEDGYILIGDYINSDEEFHIGDEIGGSSDTAIAIENDNSGTDYIYEIHVEDTDEFVIYQGANEDSGNSVLMYNGTTQHWGFGTDPTANELQMDSGAHITAGGVFTDASSRAYKTGIESITLEEAKLALELLDPVRFQYKEQLGEEYLGFIAEDVPDLVATSDRKGLSSMDIVAVLVKVNQDQQQRIDTLEQELEALKQVVSNL